MEGNYLISTNFNDTAFVINVPKIKFGMNTTKEVGKDAVGLKIKNALVVVGPRLKDSKQFHDVLSSLSESGINYAVFDEVKTEPDDENLTKGYEAIKGKKIDGLISFGGGSTIDTAKILNLLYKYPRDINDYINKPIGKGMIPEGDLLPHIAIPTTAGTGSETTNVTIFDVERLHVKTGISNPFIRPSLAIIDPVNTLTMPPKVTASTGLDVLNHAIESYTSHPYTARPPVASPDERPVYSGSTPIGDLFGLQAIEWVHKYLRRAFADPLDLEARYYMTMGASIAGMGFGHVGVHIPHAMAYPIAGMIKKWHPDDYDFGYPISPHGISTAIPAAYVFRYLSKFVPERFADVLTALGYDTEGMSAEDIGDTLYGYYIDLLHALKIPDNLSDLDFTSSDIEKLVDGTMAQQRLIGLSPKKIDKSDIEFLFKEAMGR
ncbi:alcohol dehydrogenase [ADH] [Thermoplasma volcanium GSS1]|uniref:hydroxyacid-oxoacid transhydrogenase n=1 Tax=Thermoplasma volcanium (strain ATCC 51530 / DSM 4299 / JCM 9571 / NBRC 15438 / GSS1) TaxID=273116 RepID=Q978V8_THEVO|nr:hydroxyacid-oxoacid transhydrogenase [Thermoplasma volcanium]BAB60449.1 alcohol dehydrogenase [ADH] [Thermoplasma volcanium GSS1]